MAARRKNKSAQPLSKAMGGEVNENATKGAATMTGRATAAVANAHLPPLALVCTALLCSGFLAVLALRDYMTTGRNVLGELDEAYLLYTKSTDWYDDSKGWKSTQGGFSAIAAVSSDANNMGGFFVRKCAGAFALGWQLIKLWPLLVHVPGSIWDFGHYNPHLWTSIIGNLVVAAFLLSCLPDWYAERISNQLSMVEWAWLLVSVLVLESCVFAWFAMTCRTIKRRHVVQAFSDGKKPSSTPSNIVTRTVVLITGAMTIVSVRDLFFTGRILEFWPRDDVYLEWTNALRHSPPVGSPEWDDGAINAPLYVGDKFISQYMAVNMLVVCFAKIVSALAIRLGPDGERGVYQAKILWQGTCLADALFMVVIRLFTPAAASASWDLRYALMAVGYETFMLGLYGFF